MDIGSPRQVGQFSREARFLRGEEGLQLVGCVGALSFDAQSVMCETLVSSFQLGFRPRRCHGGGVFSCGLGGCYDSGGEFIGRDVDRFRDGHDLFN